MSKLSNLGEVLNGKTIPREKGLYPAYGGNGIISYISKWNYPENTIIIGRVGANCGAVHFSNSKCWVTDNALAFIVNKNNDPYFVYYLLKLIDLNNFHIGSSQPLITQSIINNIDFDYIIDKQEQSKISKVLKTIDKKIIKNNNINEQLNLISQTLYDYWFLQFEFPNEEGKPYKSSGGKMVWNEELKREIPKGWIVENLMETSICKDIKAGVDYFDTKNYLPTANINGETITDGENVTYVNRENRANMQPIKYSVWFAKMKNSIKHLSIPNNSEWFINKYILSTGFQGLKCSEDSFSFIHCVVNSSWFETYKDVLSHGATQEGVNNEDLKNIKFAVPTDKILKQFSKIVLSVLERKFAIIKENYELSSLRDFLLPLLMNGQVTFKNESYE